MCLKFYVVTVTPIKSIMFNKVCKCRRASSATFKEAKMSYNMEQMIQMLFSCTSATCPRCHLVNAICPTCCWASAIWPKCHLSHMPNVPAAKCLKCHWSRPPNVLSAICRGRHLASAKWSNAGQSSATSHSPLAMFQSKQTRLREDWKMNSNIQSNAGNKHYFLKTLWWLW